MASRNDTLTQNPGMSPPTPEPEPPPVMVSDGNEEFPIPLARFLPMLPEHDQVFATHLRVKHGRENHTPTAWRTILDGHRDTPAHPEHPDYDHAIHG